MTTEIVRVEWLDQECIPTQLELSDVPCVRIEVNTEGMTRYAGMVDDGGTDYPLCMYVSDNDVPCQAYLWAMGNGWRGMVEKLEQFMEILER